ncbi:MAG: Hsp20/alpha crystallin family protein [Patescibacteria group bacterium]|nr:Hsp20/alpha crystallin family protein [Patescibacteria group bacterium]MDE1988553.1 Hsp20/alpha crystallin family protein [Patescibacteria group bacterium]MDE2218614.1 Hsp20/alpha crystallin family protein [Patescibacteria group bacterium]
MKITKKEEKKTPKVVTKVAKVEPQRNVVSLRDMMNKMIEESFWDPFDIVSSNLSMMPEKKMSFPKVDISETEKEIKITANVPGIDSDKIDIDVGDDYISISGRTEKEEEEKDKKIYRYEREYGEFRREFSLPVKVKKDEVSAKVKNGVLTINLPKIEEEKKSKIKVKAE